MVGAPALKSGVPRLKFHSYHKRPMHTSRIEWSIAVNNPSSCKSSYKHVEHLVHKEFMTQKSCVIERAIAFGVLCCSSACEPDLCLSSHLYQIMNPTQFLCIEQP